MNILRYRLNETDVQLAVRTDDGFVHDLPQPDFLSLIRQSREAGLSSVEWVQQWIRRAEPINRPIDELQLVVPLDAPEVWAAGVTYELSRQARNYEVSRETDSRGQTCYDKVYDAERPEIFLKSTAARTVGPDEEMCLRNDSGWQIPEPELGLVITGEGTIVGYTIGNDLSCRDIEGENPLYLPQAKIWKGSCSIGPYVRLAPSVPDPYDLTISCKIFRAGELAASGTAHTSQLKRKLDELVSYLIRNNQIFDGTVLLTGTSIVPPDDFTLAEGDVVEIGITGLGTLRNRMKQLD